MQIQNEKLLKACRKGNRLAQMQVYDLYAKAMFSITLRYLKDREDAKDVMQEGFLKAFTKIESYRPDSSFGSWLKRIIINQSIDALKKKKMEFNDLNVEKIEISDDDWNFDVQISKDQILKAIEELKDNQKVVIKLYLIEGYDHSEIAEILEITEGTSRTHLHRGRLSLQNKLKPIYNETRH
jgi:RNA polymerase sigma-70 factor (ECF subfamily)